MKVSVITINYNNAAGLRKTIESVVCHKYAGFEYIVIDGNSEDESVTVIQDYSQNIDYWISESDSGIYNAMNKGIHKAKGEYVLFINSGDTLQANADLISVINRISDEDIVYFNLEISNNRSAYLKTYPDTLDFKYFAEESLPHAASFIKRERLTAYGCYSEQLKIVSDWCFFIDAVCLHNLKYKHIEDCFSTFYLDGISSNNDSQNLIQEEKQGHINAVYPMFATIYSDWSEKKQELYKLKSSASVRYLKKIGLLRWLQL